jgi:hypothetical protein
MDVLWRSASDCLTAGPRVSEEATFEIKDEGWRLFFRMTADESDITMNKKLTEMKNCAMGSDGKRTNLKHLKILK